MLIRYYFRKFIFFLPVSFIYLCFTTGINQSQFLIVPPQLKGFSDNLELTLPLLLLLIFSFIQYDEYETELCIVSGTSLRKIVISKVLTLYTYILLSALIVISLYSYIPYDSDEYKILIPIHVPIHHKIISAISIVVSSFFFTSLFVFLRIAIRNCYLSVGTGFFFYYFFANNSIGIKEGSVDIIHSIQDPFISTYFSGNTIPNAYAKFTESLNGLSNGWTSNRILFTLIALLLLYLCNVLLSKEKIHKAFDE